ncbi:hypothetical protein TPENAI_60766 [Tenacibaculum litopenaei]|uniref:hypothetical protein n=1 Tax=Tenacibaculum litopenaei TaxID=396016 RepID=UPI0038946F88
MKTIPVTGQGSKSFTIDHNNQPQRLILSNIYKDATIELSMERQGESKIRTISPVKVAFLIELQNKIEFLQGKRLQIFRYATESSKEVIASGIIDVGIGGEIVLQEKDYMFVDLKTLDNASFNISISGGLRTAGTPFQLRKTKVDSGNSELKVDLSQQRYIIFDKASMPDEIDFIRGDEKVVMSKELLLQEQENIFGVVAYDKTNVPVFGTNQAVVLQTAGLDGCYFRWSADLAKDFYYWIV